MKRLFALFLALATGCTDMPTQYTPNPANNPATIPRPSDGDPPNASSINPSIEALADKDSRKLDKTSGGTVTGDIVTSGAVSIGGTSTFLIGTQVQEEHSNTPNFINGALFSFAGTLTCQRPASFTQTVTCSNTAGTALSCTGPVSISGASGSLYSGGTGGSEFATDVLVDAKLTRNGAGHDVFRMVTPAAGNQTFTISSGDLFRKNTIAADTNWTFQNTGATAGCVIKVSLKFDAGAFNLFIKRHDGTTIATLRGDNITGSPTFAELWHDGTDWVVASLVKN